jgi:hypothetical protein
VLSACELGPDQLRDGVYDLRRMLAISGAASGRLPPTLESRLTLTKLGRGAAWTNEDSASRLDGHGLLTLTELFENASLDLKTFLRELSAQNLAEVAPAPLKAILKRQWDALQKEPADKAEEALKEWKAKRGFDFERMVFKLLALEGLEPSPPYYAHPKRPVDKHDAPRRRGRPPGGEQIDGSFAMDGKYFLIETKWQQPMTASDIYAFRGRVEGKLVGTVGVLLSAGGFAENAEYALIWGKELNVLLVERSDVGLALEPGNSFRDMMREKLREAARTGRAFFAYTEALDRRRK